MQGSQSREGADHARGLAAATWGQWVEWGLRRWVKRGSTEVRGPCGLRTLRIFVLEVANEFDLVLNVLKRLQLAIALDQFHGVL